MFGTERISGITERSARGADNSLGVALDHGINLSDRNISLARKWLEHAAGELRSQDRVNQRFAQRMLDDAEKQREAFQELGRESLGFCMELAFAPFSHYRQGQRNVEDNVRDFPGVWSVNAGFPIQGYDELRVAEVSRRLTGLSDEQIRQVREYEKKNKNRHSLIERLDRRIGNAS